MNKKGRSFSFDMLFVIALFCFFAVVSLLLIGIGSGVYRNTKESFSSEHVLRTALSYVSGKTRYNAAVSASEKNIDGTNALIFSEITDSGNYDTVIYFYKGDLCEQYVSSETEVSLSSGNSIVALDKFEFSLVNDGTLKLDAEINGLSRTLYLSVNRFVGVEQ